MKLFKEMHSHLIKVTINLHLAFTYMGKSTILEIWIIVSIISMNVVNTGRVNFELYSGLVRRF